MKKNYRVVISCASGIVNSGDEAILESLLKYYPLPNKKNIVVFSFDPAFTEREHGVKSVGHSLKNIKKIIFEINNCDLFIMGGGGLLQDETSLLNPSFWLLKLFLAIIFKKKTYILANSVGPLKYKLNRLLVRLVLNRIDFITVRDQISKDLLNRIGVRKKVSVTIDPVFLMETKNISTIKQKEKCVVFFLRHWFDNHPLLPVKMCIKLGIKDVDAENRFLKEMVKTVDWFNKRNYLVKFVSMCPGRDALIAERIKSEVRNKNKVVIVDKYLKPTEIVKIIKTSDMAVCMRLHSIIYSLLAGKRFIAISYSQKVRNLLSVLRLIDNNVEIDNLTFLRFKKALNSSERSRLNLRNYIDTYRKIDFDNLRRTKV